MRENHPYELADRINVAREAGFPKVRALMRRAVSEGVTPGGVVWMGVGVQDKGFVESFCIAEGNQGAQGTPKVTPETIYDLASLTKPLACALWFATLVSDGSLDPKQPIGDVLSIADPMIKRSPCWRLVNHSSGLPAHRRYYEGLAGAIRLGSNHARCREVILRMIRETYADYCPGEKSIYSDLGYLLLEHLCEVVSGESLIQFWQRCSPSAGLHYRPLNASISGEQVLPSRYAPTEDCPWREHVLQGEVHDDNAWLMGGVCGHAGLFGAAEATGLAAGAWLRAWRGDSDALPASPEVIRWMCSLDHRAPQGGSFVLGWDTPSPGYSSAGRQFSRMTIGHLGFTGTSLWIDLEREVVVALLTNRVFPSRARPESVRGIRWLRPMIHDAIWDILIPSQE